MISLAIILLYILISLNLFGVTASKGLDALQLYPMDTTIVKVGKCFQFT